MGNALGLWGFAFLCVTSEALTLGQTWCERSTDCPHSSVSCAKPPFSSPHLFCAWSGFRLHGGIGPLAVREEPAISLKAKQEFIGVHLPWSILAPLHAATAGGPTR